jgi:hypothetical protein
MTSAPPHSRYSPRLSGQALRWATTRITKTTRAPANDGQDVPDQLD